MATPNSGSDEEPLLLYLLLAAKNTKKKRWRLYEINQRRKESGEFYHLCVKPFSNKTRLVRVIKFAKKKYTRTRMMRREKLRKNCAFSVVHFRPDSRDLCPLSVLIARLGRRPDSCNQALTDYRFDVRPPPRWWVAGAGPLTTGHVPRKQKLWTIIKWEEGVESFVRCTPYHYYFNMVKKLNYISFLIGNNSKRIKIVLSQNTFSFKYT